MMHWAPLPMELLMTLWLTVASLCLARRYNSRFPVSLPSLAILTICHKGDTLCSFGQGTTSGLPEIR